MDHRVTVAHFMVWSYIFVESLCRRGLEWIDAETVFYGVQNRVASNQNR